MDNRYHKLPQFIQYVIDWNKVFLNPDMTLDERIDLQKKVTVEEINETLAALMIEDPKEIIDGIGDILVTAGYLRYLYAGESVDFLNSSLFNYDIKYENYYQYVDVIHFPLIDLKNHILHETTSFSYDTLNYLACYAICDFGRDNVENYFNAILLSNDTKFVPVEQWVEFNDEYMEAAQEKYEGKYKDLVWWESDFRGEPVFLIRADHGRGKILKPPSFKEPSDLLFSPKLF